MKLIPHTLAALAALAMAGSASAAAVVTYSYYTAISSADTSWVNVSGYNSLVAGNLGGPSTSFGSVTWGNMTPGNSTTSANVTISSSLPWAADVFYSGGPDLLKYGTVGPDLTSTISLSGLTVGQDYKVQFVLADTRVDWGYATILAQGANVTGDSNRIRYSYSDGRFAVITASFTADATTAEFLPGQRWGDDVPDATFINGVQVLAAVPEPSTALLGGLGLLGMLCLLRRRR